MDGNAPRTILMIHGWPDTAALWEPQVAALETGHWVTHQGATEFNALVLECVSRWSMPMASTSLARLLAQSARVLNELPSAAIALRRDRSRQTWHSDVQERKAWSFALSAGGVTSVRIQGVKALFLYALRISV